MRNREGRAGTERCRPIARRHYGTTSRRAELAARTRQSRRGAGGASGQPSRSRTMARAQAAASPLARPPGVVWALLFNLFNPAGTLTLELERTVQLPPAGRSRQWNSRARALSTLSVRASSLRTQLASAACTRPRRTDRSHAGFLRFYCCY